MGAREVDKKTLDLFWQLRESDETKQNIAIKKICVKLNASLQKSKDGEVASDAQYCITRLVKGLAASSDDSRRGFLKCFQNVVNGKYPSSVNFFREIINKQLEVSGSLSKSETTDTLRAQILAHKAILASGKVSGDEIGNDIARIVEAGSQKAILAPVAAEAVTAVLDKVSPDAFQENVWPTLQPFICIPWDTQTVERLGLLFKCLEKYPSVVTNKIIKKTMGCELLSSETYPHLAKLLVNSESSSAFPQGLFSHLQKVGKVAEFLPVLQDVLEEHSKPKSLSYLSFLITLVEKGDAAHMSLILSPAVCKILGEKTEENGKLVDRLTKLIQKKLAMPEVGEEVQSAVAKAVVKAAKNSETSISAFGLLQVLLPSFGAEAVKKVCTLLKKVVEDNEKKTKDRIMALHQLTRATCHQALKNEPEFIEKIINKMVAMAFKSSDTPRELIIALKEQIVKIVESPSSKVEQWCGLLANTIMAINSTISGDFFKKPSAKQNWDRILAKLNELNGVEKKDWCSMIFVMIYAHVAFLLLQDPSMVEEVLEDLDKCFEKSQKKKSKKRKSEVQDSEPSWVEVMTDMLLYLLGQNKSSLRNMCNVTWKLLVPHLNENALKTVLDVLKFTEEDGDAYRPPSAKKQKTDDSDDDESDLSDESESDMDDDDEKGGSDYLIKLKMDLHNALGDNAALTDQESIDLDDINDEAMKSMDEALSLAFQANKAAKPKKKQTKHEEKESLARMHLKMRALDLIEITIGHTSDYRLIQMIILPLAESFSESFKSDKQAQLQNRMRNALKSLRDWKPKDETSEVDPSALIQTLQQLIAIPIKNSSHASDVAEGLSHAFSCVMKLALQSEKSDTEQTPKKKKSKISKSILCLLSETLEDFGSGKAAAIPSYFIYKALDVQWPLRLELFRKLIDVCINHQEIGKQKRLTLLAMLKNAVKNPTLVAEALKGDDSLIGVLYKHSAELFSATEFAKPEHAEIFETLNTLHPNVKKLESMNDASEELKKAIVHYHDKVSVSKDAKTPFTKLMTLFGLKFTQKKCDLPKQAKPEQPAGVPKSKAEKNAEQRKKIRKRRRELKEKLKKAKAEKKKLAKADGGTQIENESATGQQVTPKKESGREPVGSGKKRKMKENDESKVEETPEVTKEPKSAKKVKQDKSKMPEESEAIAEPKSAKKMKKEKTEVEDGKPEAIAEPKSAKKMKKEKTEVEDEKPEAIAEPKSAKKMKKEKTEVEDGKPEAIAEPKSAKKIKKEKAEVEDGIEEPRSTKKAKKEKLEVEEKSETVIEPKSAKKAKKEKSEEEKPESVVDSTPAKKTKENGIVVSETEGTVRKSARKKNQLINDQLNGSPAQKTPRLRKKSAVNLDE